MRLVEPSHSKTGGSEESFRPGQPIPEDGIYRVLHAGHRVSHELTLLGGHVFPECAKCGKDVQFELIRTAPRLEADFSFRIKLYTIPHPQEEDEATEDKQLAG